MAGLSGKVAVVTGASRGIGRAIALRLARDGAAVVVNYAASSADAQAVVAAIERSGGTAAALRADVAVRGEITALFDAADARFGGIDIVVNNAGVLVLGAVSEVTERDFDRVFAVNARGAFFVMQESARRLRDGGRLISLSSSVTLRPLPHTAVYAASKAAVELFTKALAREVGHRQITVNAVAPGGTETGMLSPQRAEELKAETALARVGQPTDIADAVAMLAGDDAHWITGQIIHVSGGQV
jgi:3-oxoacyl-[acyl-carrier protein] reductase